MEAALIRALEALPGAALIGIPLSLAVRALWQECKEVRAALVSALMDKIKSDIEMKNVLERIIARMPRGEL